jgi:hypothetical protein
MKLFEIKKQTPDFLLTESKNVHLEHLEDLIFNLGYQGGIQALNYIESLRAMLGEGTGTTTKLTVKWDGSPAIICGVDPSDSRFFIGTKSVFAKGEPKLCKSPKDIERFYSEQPELASKLASALKYLPKLGIGKVLQGDLMFTEDDLSTVTVNDEDCYVFTPNTITYAVPVNSQLGQRIARAKLGIIFHTVYEGDTIESMTARFGVNVSGLNQHADVWFDDATYKDYTGIASLTPTENTKIKKYQDATLKTMEKIGQQRFDIILSNKEFARTVKPFINQSIRQGIQIDNPVGFLKQFVSYYTKELTKDEVYSIF